MDARRTRILLEKGRPPHEAVLNGISEFTRETRTTPDTLVMPESEWIRWSAHPDLERVLKGADEPPERLWDLRLFVAPVEFIVPDWAEDAVHGAFLTRVGG